MDSAPGVTIFQQMIRYLRRQTPMQTLITVVVAFAALKVLAPILAPLLFAGFLIAVVRPLQRRFQRVMADSLAIGFTLIIFLAVIGIFIAILWFAGLSLIRQWPQYAEVIDRYLRLAADYGLAPTALGRTASLQAWLEASSFDQEALLALGEGLAIFGGGLTLVIAYLIMGLLEVDVLDDKVQHMLPDGGVSHHWFQVATAIAAQCRRYLLVRSAIGLLSGLLVGIATWLIGLDFVLLWSLLAFLLKYIPTLGSLLITLLPTLFALLQFGDWRRALITLVALTVLQGLQGNIINPLFQGKYLSISPLAIVLSVVFWGWLWGVIGAFLAVPLTVLIIVTCRQFERTLWIATLLADWDEEELDRTSSSNSEAVGQGESESAR